jgi:class 3 adenylate cyclase/tetratricopeptide (TPR) repeat protein
MLRPLIPHFITTRYQDGQHRGAFPAAALFVDISGFTPLTESLMQHDRQGAETLSSVINSIFDPVVHEVYARSGFVAEFAGDAYVALFSLRQFSAAEQAVAAAMAVQQFFAEHSRIVTPFGEFEIGVKIGLGLGQVQWGILGRGGKHTYYFRGPAIQQAVGGQILAETGAVVASQSLCAAVPGLTGVQPVGETIYSRLPPGLRQPVRTAPLFRSVEDRATLSAFVLDTVIDRESTGEFRDVCPVFISIGEPELEFLDELVTAILNLAYRYGGYFHQIEFTDKGGVCVLLFGAPVAYENNLERAAEFLSAFRQHVGGALNLTGAQWRASLAQGTVYAGIRGGRERCEYAALGDVVNIAARLVSQAASGEILVTPEAAVALGEKGYRLEFASTLTIKGRSHAIPVARLSGRQTVRTARQLHLGPLVGRATELRQLLDGLAAVRSGRSAGVAWVLGDPGIGKTRLVTEARARMAADGPILWGLCQAEDLLRQSLHPFRYFLRSYFGQMAEAGPGANRVSFELALEQLFERLPPEASGLRRELERTRSILAALVDLHWPGSLYAQLDPKLRFDNSLAALKTLIKAESLIQPVVLEVEDAQWLDADSLEFIRVLNRNIADLPIGLVVTARYRDDGTLEQTLLDKDVPQRFLHLGGLAPDALQAFVGQALQARISDRAMRSLADAAGGNPFVAEQLALDLNERDVLKAQADGTYDLSGIIQTALPTSIAAVLVSRLDRLPGEVRDVIQTAAVLGREFEVALLTRVMRSDADLPDKLKRAEREQILIAVGSARYRFKNALMREAAYEMQLRSRLREIHKLAGEAMQVVFVDDLPSCYADLAYHFEQAGLADQATYYLDQAAAQAQAAHANDAALNYYRRLLALLPPDARRSYRLKLAEVLETLGHWQEASATYRQALDETPEASFSERAAIHVHLGDCQFRLSNFPAAAEALSAGLNLARAADPRTAALALSSLSFMSLRIGQAQEGLALGEQALDLAWRGGDEAVLARALRRLGSASFELNDFERAETYWRDALLSYKHVDDREGVMACLNNLADAYRLQRDFDRALRYYDDALSVARALGNRPGIGTVLGNINVIYRLQGDYASAARCNDEALAIYREMGDLSNVGGQLKDRGLLAAEQGDAPRALAAFREALDLAQQIDEPPLVLAVFAGAAGVWARTGRAIQAAEVVAWVQAHPANNAEVAVVADRVAAELRRSLPTAEFEAAAARGRELTFDLIAAAIRRQ